MSQAEKTTDLKEIARQLSDSYYKILQHSTLNEQTVKKTLINNINLSLTLFYIHKY